MGTIVPAPPGSKPLELSVFKQETLQNAAAATGDGTVMSIDGLASIALTLATTGFSGTVLFEVSQDGTNYVTVLARQVGTLHEATGTGSLTTDTSVSVWRADVAGYSFFKAPITRSAGSITVTATASPLALADTIDGEMVIKTVAAQAITAGTAISVWTPATGSRFRLRGFAFSVSAAAYLILKDSTTVIANSPLLAAAGVFVSPDMGPKGWRSAAVNNILKLDVSASATVTGYVWGKEDIA